ncbi:MAG TPA: hypothetical protein VKB80_37650 [Kofleriaceae bacterium]|nr:hypothetical protein [Kofleriaceae bacterium]
MTKLSFPAASARRFRPVFQAAIIRAYKIVGLAALTAILIGLISFLSVNLFYLVNSSWVRPVELSPTHASVLSTMATLSSESARRDEILSEREELEAELEGLDRTIQLDQEYEHKFEGVAPRQSGAKGDQKGDQKGEADYMALVAGRAQIESIVEREKATARKKVIQSQIDRLGKSAARYDKLIADLQGSAYVQATERRVTVAFVPYDNLDNVEEGMSIYACRWGLVWCREVGVVGSALKGEVTDTHPQNGSSLRGIMVEIRLADEEAAEEQALFVGKRPFWIL